MKDLHIKAQGPNFSAIDIGEFENLMDFSFLHPKLKSEIKGKVFVGEILKSSSTEISFQILAPNTNIPFLHQHENHEEIYVILKGSGEFQVDETVFDISEGSIIRIAPEGKRSWRNNTDKPLIFMCIQGQKNSLDSYSVFDGFRTPGDIIWN